jgi:hypothetical protein
MTHALKSSVQAKFKARSLAACAVLLASIAGHSQAASFLNGHSFTWREASDYPSSEGWTTIGTVGAGNPFYGPYYTFEITDTGLSMQFGIGHSFEERFPSLNGYNLQVNGAPWIDTGLQIEAVSSAWAGFFDPTELRLTHDNTFIHIDFGGLTVRAGDALVVSLTPLSAPVPEPAPVALLTAGLALLGWQLQRRRQGRDS